MFLKPLRASLGQGERSIKRVHLHKKSPRRVGLLSCAHGCTGADAQLLCYGSPRLVAGTKPVLTRGCVDEILTAVEAHHEGIDTQMAGHVATNHEFLSKVDPVLLHSPARWPGS